MTIPNPQTVVFSIFEYAEDTNEIKPSTLTTSNNDTPTTKTNTPSHTLDSSNRTSSSSDTPTTSNETSYFEKKLVIAPSTQSLPDDTHSVRSKRPRQISTLLHDFYCGQVDTTISSAIPGQSSSL